MAKVMISAMALRQARSEGHPLAFAQQTDVSNALINSDNDSADRLWAYAGGADAYQRLANELQMTSSHRDAKRPDWSWTWTTPRDQVTLLSALINGTPALVDEVDCTNSTSCARPIPPRSGASVLSAATTWPSR